MKLTHENVRALLSLVRDIDVPNAGGLAPQQETALALCEQWLAAHTVRWDGYVLRRSSDRRGLSIIGPAWCGWGATALPSNRGEWDVERTTEAEARAWCEEQARAEGYEVER